MSGQNKRGISSVLGIVIAIGILVSAVVPLWLFQISTENLQRQAIENRIQVDKERLDESLELKAYEDWYMGTHEILVLLKNTCYLTITIVRIYLTPRNNPLKPPLETTITLPPFSDDLEVNTHVLAESGVTYDVKVVTERGNVYLPVGGSFTGGSGRGFPSTLSVTLINMRKGLLYTLDVAVVSYGEEEPPPYFPVHQEWKATAENQFQSLCFGISPGVYRVAAADNKNWTETIVVDTTVPGVQNPTVVFDCSEHLKKNSTVVP